MVFRLYREKSKLFSPIAAALFLLDSVFIFLKLFQYSVIAHFSFSLMDESLSDIFHVLAILLFLYSLAEAAFCLYRMSKNTFYCLGIFGSIQVLAVIVIDSFIDDGGITPDFSLLGVLYLVIAFAAATLCFLAGWMLQKSAQYSYRYTQIEHKRPIYDAVIFCDVCQNANRPSARFCDYCGNPLNRRMRSSNSKTEQM